MDERIKLLRKTLDLSQEGFAKPLGLQSRGKIANLEAGKVEPDEDFIRLICRVFHVNETWLRTGDGEMFIPQARDREISDFFTEVMKGKDDTFKRRLVAVLARLDEDAWIKFEQLARDLLAADRAAEKENRP